MHLLFIDFTWLKKSENLIFKIGKIFLMCPMGFLSIIWWDRFWICLSLFSINDFREEGCYPNSFGVFLWWWSIKQDAIHLIHLCSLGILEQSLTRKLIVWRNLGFIRNHAGSKFTHAERAQAKGNLKKVSPKDAKYVTDNHKDLHAQIRRILEEVLGVQLLKNGLKWQFTLMGKTRKGVHTFFSIAFFMGDTVEHNKLSSLCGGPNATYLCQICPSTLLDQPGTAMTLEEKKELKKKGKKIPPNTFTLTDSKRMKLDHIENPRKVVEKGYYPFFMIWFFVILLELLYPHHLRPCIPFTSTWHYIA